MNQSKIAFYKKNIYIWLFVGFYFNQGFAQENFLDVETEDSSVQVPNEPPYINGDNIDGNIEELKTNENQISMENQSQKKIDDSNLHKNIVENKKQKSFKIRHPEAKNGLQYIDKNGVYFYQMKKNSKSDQTSTIKFSQSQPPKIQGSNSLSFTDYYSSSQLTILDFSYESKLTTSIGPIGLQYGLGFLSSTGAGRFKDSGVQTSTCSSNCEAKETYTFYGLPISVGGTYRLELASRQWIAPFISGGIVGYFLAELRSDNKKNNFLIVPGAYASVGGLINLTAMSRELSYSMDNEYGVSNMWLVGELKQLQTFRENVDMSSTLMSLGVSVDY